MPFCSCLCAREGMLLPVAPLQRTKPGTIQKIAVPFQEQLPIINSFHSRRMPACQNMPRAL